MRTPAAIVAIPLLAGCASAILLVDRLPDLFAVHAAAGALLAAVAAAALFGLGSPFEFLFTIAIGCALAGWSLGADAADRAYHPPLLNWFTSLAPPKASDPVILEGTLREDAVQSPLGTSMWLNVDCVRTNEGGDPRIADCRRLHGGVRLSVAGNLATDRLRAWRSGRRVRVAALLRLPTVYRNPGVADDRRSLARRGVVLVGSVKSGALVEVLQTASATDEAANAARAWIRSRLAVHVGHWSPRSAAVSIAITVGDRTGMAADDERRLQEGGTYHVIAISGGNIAILTAILLVSSRIVRAPPRVAAAAVILMLLFYARVTGAPPSVGRAVMAAITYLAGRMLDHRGPPLNALAVAATLVTITSPLTGVDPGFLLSFGATLGILVLAPRFAAAMTPASMVPPGRRATSAPMASGRRKAASSVVFSAGVRALRALMILFIATICAETALAPLGALFFLRVTFAGLLLNFVAIPLMTIVQIGSLLALATSWSSIGALACGYATHLAARWLVDSARLVDVVPQLSIHVPPPAAALVAAYYGACVCAIVLRTRGRLLAATAAAVSLAVMIAGPVWSARDPVPFGSHGTLRVAMLDVAQGDATLVVLPDGRSLLVDSGGQWSSEPPAPASPPAMDRPSAAFDIGDRIVGPAVRALGVHRVDTLVLTHGDPDHIGGADAVMRWFTPHVIWEGVPVPPFEWMRLLRERASRARMQWRYVQAGDVDKDGAVAIRVLHPPLPGWERQRVRNDDSIVLDLRLGDVSIVLPADIGGEGERAVVSAFEPARITILKVPHHGSATSSTEAFVRALHPAVAIISCGRENRFGHPAPLVVARYRDAGIPVFRTDRDGAVFVETDGKTVRVRGWTGRGLALTADTTRRP